MNAKDKQSLESILRKYVNDIETQRIINFVCGKASQKNPTVAEIKQSVELAFNLPRGHIESDSRNKIIAGARHVAMYLAYSMTPSSYPAIGKSFKRDHTSVIHAVKRVQKSAALRLIADNIRESLISKTPVEPISSTRIAEMIAMEGANYAA